MRTDTGEIDLDLVSQLKPAGLDAAVELLQRIARGPVFLDLDDTLLDYQRERELALHDLAHALGIPASRFLAAYARAGKTPDAAGRGEPGRLRTAMAACLPGLTQRNMADAIECYYQHRLTHVRPLKGARSLVRVLRDNCPRLVLATHGLERIQCRRLVKAGLSAYFDDVLVSESRGATKENWTEFVPAGYRADLPYSTVISDSPYPDLLQGSRAGMATVLVDTCNRAQSNQHFDLTVTGPQQLARVLLMTSRLTKGGA